MDCLVTRLKSVANDSSLPKLGTLRFELNEGTMSQQLATNLIGDNFATSELSLISGNCRIYDLNNGGKELSFPVDVIWNGYYKIVVGSGGAVVELTQKYEMKHLDLFWGLMNPINVSAFDYMSKMVYINFGVTEIKRGAVGDAKELARLQSLTNVYWANPLCYGEVGNFGKLPKLTNLTLWGGKVTGDLKDIAITARSIGRTTGTIQLGSINGDVMWAGEKIYEPNGTTLSWDASSITWNGKRINA